LNSDGCSLKADRAEGVIRHSPTTKRRVTPEPVIGPRSARTRWAKTRLRAVLVPRMLRSTPHQTPASFPDVQLHIVDAPLGAGPESILPIVVMDSGLAPSGAPRNDRLISIQDTSEMCSRRRVVICPSGGLLKGLSSPICKNISLPWSVETSL